MDVKSAVQLTDQLVFSHAYEVYYLCLSRFYCLILFSSDSLSAVKSRQLTQTDRKVWEQRQKVSKGTDR